MSLLWWWMISPSWWKFLPMEISIPLTSLLLFDIDSLTVQSPETNIFVLYMVVLLLQQWWLLQISKNENIAFLICLCNDLVKWHTAMCTWTSPRIGRSVGDSLHSSSSSPSTSCRCCSLRCSCCCWYCSLQRQVLLVTCRGCLNCHLCCYWYCRHC